MKTTIEVDESELKVIQDIRRTKSLKELHRRIVVNALCVACDFERWLQESGMFPTFSTFCEWMENAKHQETDRPNLYELVLKIRSAAWGDDSP